MKDTRVLFQGEKYSCGRILVYPDYNPGLKIGNQILVRGDLVKFLPASNPGQFDELQYYKTKWIHYKMYGKSIQVTKNHCWYLHQQLYQWKEKLGKVYEAVLPEGDAGIMKAMVLGDKGSLNKEMSGLYQDSGISHILAISGVKTLCLVSPLSLENGLKWGFRRLHNAKKFIQNLCFKGQFLDRCPPRFCGG